MAVQSARIDRVATGAPNDHPTGAAPEHERIRAGAIGAQSRLCLTFDREGYAPLVDGKRWLLNRAVRDAPANDLVGNAAPSIVTAANSKPALQLTGAETFGPADPDHLSVVSLIEGTVLFVGYPESAGTNQLLGAVPGAPSDGRSLCVGFATADQRMRFFDNANASLGTSGGTGSNANQLVRVMWGWSPELGLTVHNGGTLVWADATFTSPLLTLPQFQVGGGLTSGFRFKGKIQLLEVVSGIHLAKPAHSAKFAAVVQSMAWY